LSPSAGDVLRGGPDAAALAARADSAAAALPSLGVKVARTRPPGFAAVAGAPPLTLKTSVVLS